MASDGRRIDVRRGRRSTAFAVEIGLAFINPDWFPE
jgi:hypothetical protein